MFRIFASQRDKNMNAILQERNTRIANIAGTLDEIASRQPGLNALIQSSGQSARSISYRQLAERVSSKAGLLRGAGLRKGDLVLMLEPMSIDLYVSILAVFRLGATVLILDASAGKEKLDHAIARTGPRAVIASGKGILAALALRSVRRIALKFSRGFTPPGWHSLRDTRGYHAVAVETVEPSHPALITLTSGTSGKPKMIVRSHDFLRKQLDAVASNCGVKSGSCELTSLPVFVLANLASSVTTIIPDTNLSRLATADLLAVIDQISAYRPDRILGSPIFVERIMNICKARGIRLNCVEKIITGGGPVFPRLLSSAKAVCPFADLVTVYGSSEAEPISKISFDSLNNEDLDAIANGAGLPVGFPVEQIRIRIEPLVEQEHQLRNPDRLATLRHICELGRLPIDAIGEIVVTGEHVVKGYDRGYGDEETKMRIEGEIWHRTGDIGYFDRSGRLWLTGRLSKTAHGNGIDTTFAQSIEAAALADARVGRVACLTKDDVTTLFVEADGALIDTWVLKNRLNWSQLSAVKLIDKIPVDTRHSSKVLYDKLAEEER